VSVVTKILARSVKTLVESVNTLWSQLQASMRTALKKVLIKDRISSENSSFSTLPANSGD